MWTSCGSSLRKNVVSVQSSPTTSRGMFPMKSHEAAEVSPPDDKNPGYVSGGKSTLTLAPTPTLPSMPTPVHSGHKKPTCT